jgi:hypothetical protein
MFGGIPHKQEVSECILICSEGIETELHNFSDIIVLEVGVVRIETDFENALSKDPLLPTIFQKFLNVLLYLL